MPVAYTTEALRAGQWIEGAGGFSAREGCLQVRVQSLGLRAFQAQIRKFMEQRGFGMHGSGIRAREASFASCGMEAFLLLCFIPCSRVWAYLDTEATKELLTYS